MSARDMARRIVAVVTLPDAQALALTDVIEHTIERAVSAERKACLAIAHEHGKGSSGDFVERLIRERGVS